MLGAYAVRHWSQTQSTIDSVLAQLSCQGLDVGSLTLWDIRAWPETWVGNYHLLCTVTQPPPSVLRGGGVWGKWEILTLLISGFKRQSDRNQSFSKRSQASTTPLTCLPDMSIWECWEKALAFMTLVKMSGRAKTATEAMGA